MGIFPHILHTYPAEWFALASAFAAVIIAAAAFYDAHLTRAEVHDIAGDESELCQLATVELESVSWNFFGQFALLIVAVVSVLTPPPPWPSYENTVPHVGIAESMAHGWIIRMSLTLVSVFSVLRDLRMMRVRSTIVSARRRRLLVITETGQLDVAELSKNISSLHDVMLETTVLEQETLVAVKETQLISGETKELAQEIKTKIDQGRE